MRLLGAILIFTIMLSPLIPALVLGGVNVAQRIYNSIQRTNRLAASDDAVAMSIPAVTPTHEEQGVEARSIPTAA